MNPKEYNTTRNGCKLLKVRHITTSVCNNNDCLHMDNRRTFRHFALLVLLMIMMMGELILSSHKVLRLQGHNSNQGYTQWLVQWQHLFNQMSCKTEQKVRFLLEVLSTAESWQ